MNKDTRFSIRKLTVGVASIAVASFLTSGSVDAADLSVLHSQDEKAAGYNPELPFEPFPPSITYTQPEAPWMQGSVDSELPGDDVEDVTEPGEANYDNPEAPFAPVEEVSEPREANYDDPEAPFAPVEEEEVTEPRKPNYEDPGAPFALVEEEEEVTEPRKPNYEDPEAPFAPVEEDEEVTEPRKPNYEDPEAPFAPVEEDDDVTEPREPDYSNPEQPFEPAPVEDDEENLGFEVLPGYKVEEAVGADGKTYKRLVPIEDETEEEVEEETPETEEAEFEVLPGYKVEEAIGADGKTYKRLVPIEEETEEEVEETPEVEEAEFEVLPGYKVEEVVGADGKTYKRLVPVEETEPEEEDSPAFEVKVVQETEILPYETERRANADMYVGDEKIVQPGQEGKVVKEFEVTYAGDEEISRKEVRVVESEEPVTEIVDYGTKPVQDTKVETRRVEEVLPVVEQEDPELSEGETRNVPGEPKVTEITEEITYERGKEVSRKTTKEEVIDEGTAEIKYIGTKRVETITETETIPYETEHKENSDLYEDEEKVIQEGQVGKITKEYEVTYIKGEEVDRQEGRVVESVDPVKEIIEFGTKPVMTTGTEKHQVEEALPVVEEEDPELLEGEIRTEPGSPKVTEITEEIIFERGKEVSRKVINREVIDEGTAAIKYTGIKRVETITETETLLYETERKENPDLYEDEEKVVQEGQEGKITKEYEVTYNKGEEVDRQEGRVVESVDPVKEIIEFGTKPVMTTGTEKHQVEEVLPVVEKEDPELLEGQTRTEPGSPKVTEITEEITYERGKEVSRKTIKEEVIDEGTAEIKYVGIKRVETITDTKEISYETVRKENPDLYEDEEKVIQAGQEGKITKEYEVTYIKGEETDRQEVRVVENVEPVTEIVEYGTKPLTEWTVDYREMNELNDQVKDQAASDRQALKDELKSVNDQYVSTLKTIRQSARDKKRVTSEFYTPTIESAESDQGQTIIAHYLDYYRKTMEDDSISLEQLIRESVEKRGSFSKDGFYEIIIMAAAEKVGVTGIEPGQTAQYYKGKMESNVFAAKLRDRFRRRNPSLPPLPNMYADIMTQKDENGKTGNYAPRQGALDAISHIYDEIEAFLSKEANPYLIVSGNNAASREEVLAANLDYYRIKSGKPDASLDDVIGDLAQYSIDTEGIIKMVQSYDPTIKNFEDLVTNYKLTMTHITKTETGRARGRDLQLFNDTVLEILNNLGIPAN